MTQFKTSHHSRLARKLGKFFKKQTRRLFKILYSLIESMLFQSQDYKI